MEKSATLNLQINPALKEQNATASVNADLMTADEIHTNLQSGLKDAEMGRVQDAQRILWRT